ncbi:MAG: peptidoglycan-binding domain-containing protein [Woeseiaceae bacterium]
MQRAKISLLITILAMSSPALAETAQDILDTARAKQLERWKGVDCFSKTQTVMGRSVTTYFVRTLVKTEDGGTETIFFPGSSCNLDGAPAGAMATPEGQPQGMTPDQMEAYAEGLEMTGGALSQEVGDGLEQAGMPRDLFKSMGGDPWVSPDPGTMMGGLGSVMRDAAQGQREMAKERAGNIQETADNMVAFRDAARLVGKEDIDGRQAWHLRATDIDQVEELEDGNTFTMQSISLWLDATEYVPLRSEVHGVMSDGREDRPAVIESVSSDYRTVPGSNMYESYRQTMSMSGMLDEAQQAEFAEARKEAEEARKQLEQMPADQRAMVESMMGDSLSMMDNMSADGGFTMETVIDEIQVNPDAEAMAGMSAAAAGMPVSAGTATGTPQAASPAPQSAGPAAPAEGGDGVLKMIQMKLTALGYATGNTDGLPSTETTIAISQFQAERGMEVTGKPSPQLAGVLAAEAGQGHAATPARTQEELQAARQACLEEKVAAAQEANKKKRGLGRLMSAVGRVATGSGNYDLVRKTQDIYSASATADDLAAAAKDLGIAESDIEACQNPE